MQDVTIILSGASGSVYAASLLSLLHQHNLRAVILASRNARDIFRAEVGSELEDWTDENAPSAHLIASDDWSSPQASGSSAPRTAIVIPCSAGFVARIANGISSTLLERACDVVLKESGKLVVVVRETPLNLIALRNLAKLSEAGAIVMPACPSFYLGESSLEQAASQFASRVAHVAGLPIVPGRWGKIVRRVKRKKVVRRVKKRGSPIDDPTPMKKKSSASSGDRDIAMADVYCTMRRLHARNKHLASIRHGHRYWPNVVRARRQADRLGVTYRVYVQAQVEGMRFTKTFPGPQNLGTDAAEERVAAYLATLRGEPISDPDTANVNPRADEEYLFARMRLERDEATDDDILYCYKREDSWGDISKLVSKAYRALPSSKREG